jgi:hypothetical protein
VCNEQITEYVSSVADPDPGSGAFFTLNSESGIGFSKSIFLIA